MISKEIFLNLTQTIVAKRKSFDELELLSPDELGRILLDEQNFWYLEYYDKIIAAGASLEVRNGSGLTPLHMAIIYNQFELAKLLIESGANLHDMDYIYNWTPLHHAADKRNYDIIKLLLDAGASKDDKDKLGRTPWSLATTTLRYECPELNPNHPG